MGSYGTGSIQFFSAILRETLHELKKSENRKKFAVEVNNYFDKLSHETTKQTPEEETETLLNIIMI